MYMQSVSGQQWSVIAAKDDPGKEITATAAEVLAQQVQTSRG